MFTLIVSELSTSHMFTTTEAIESSTSENRFSEFIKNLMAKLFPHNETQNNETSEQKTVTNPSKVIIPEPQPKAPPISRNDALHAIRETTSKVFDPEDPEHISIHLDNLNNLTIHLDPVIDKKTITAIHFLLENQHRNSLLDTVFWIKMVKEKELETSIPVTQKVFDTPKTEKLMILRKKLAMPKEVVVVA